MRSVQSQQPREMRINTEPLRRQDTKNVRMRHQQHIVSSVEQRFDRGDRLTCARRSFLHRLTRTVVHGHLLAVRQSFNPIAFQRFGKCLRTVAPHIPSETAHRTHFLARTALRHGRNPIPRFQGAHRNRHIRPAAPSAGLCATDWRTCTPARNPGETPHATVRRRHEPDRSQCQSTEYWCGRCAVRIRSTRSARDAAAPSGQG